MHICIMYEKYFLNRHSEQSYLLQVKENAHLGSSWTYQNSKRHRISTHELIKISVVSRNLVAICGKPSASLRAVSALNPCNACWKKNYLRGICLCILDNPSINWRWSVWGKFILVACLLGRWECVCLPCSVGYSDIALIGQLAAFQNFFREKN